MTRSQAIAHARLAAQRRPAETIYVVYDPSAGEPAGQSYYVADAADLDGYFAGLPDSAIAWASD